MSISPRTRSRRAALGVEERGIAIGVLTVLIVLLGGCRLEREQPLRPRARKAPYVERIAGSAVSFEMVPIPGAGFWIGKTEVTWDEYLIYCAFDARTPAGVDAISRPSKPLEVHPFDRNWGAGRRPAVGMSRAAAEKYCAWLSARTGRTYRLPTEAEWQLACGPEPSRATLETAWCAENGGGRTQEVGTKLPNRHGLHDVLGNLWEYCAGGFSPEEPDRPVLRGGSWQEPVDETTSASRLGFEDDWTLDDPGFPPGVWWIPDGNHLGLRVLCEDGPR